MSEPKTLLDALDLAHWELSEAFKELPDGDVWRRADPRLLSVGEIAVHIGYWEAQSFLGDHYSGPFAVDAKNYYRSNVDKPIALTLTSEDVFAELQRIHADSKAAFLAEMPALDHKNPYREGWTWGFTLQYQAFHIAYHAGQIYSVRHLLGHETVDN